MKKEYKIIGKRIVLFHNNKRLKLNLYYSKVLEKELIQDNYTLI